MGGNLEWQIFEDTDFEGNDVATCRCPDPTKLKEVALEKGFAGYTYDANTQQATFKDATRKKMIDGKTSSKGIKLFVPPDPDAASIFRLRKCVVGEGLPVFKHPMMRGNLYIDIEIDFPSSLSEAAQKSLKTLLPGPNPKDIPSDDDDDDGSRGRGGQGGPC